jgi:hypothetical protein
MAGLKKFNVGHRPAVLDHDRLHLACGSCVQPLPVYVNANEHVYENICFVFLCFAVRNPRSAIRNSFQFVPFAAAQGMLRTSYFALAFMR